MSEPLRTFSKYTPLKPLLKQAKDTAISPINLLDESTFFSDLSSSGVEAGHYNKLQVA